MKKNIIFSKMLNVRLFEKVTICSLVVLLFACKKEKPSSPQTPAPAINNVPERWLKNIEAGTPFLNDLSFDYGSNHVIKSFLESGVTFSAFYTKGKIHYIACTMLNNTTQDSIKTCSVFFYGIDSKPSEVVYTKTLPGKVSGTSPSPWADDKQNWAEKDTFLYVKGRLDEIQNFRITNSNQKLQRNVKFHYADSRAQNPFKLEGFYYDYDDGQLMSHTELLIKTEDIPNPVTNVWACPFARYPDEAGGAGYFIYFPSLTEYATDFSLPLSLLPNCVESYTMQYIGQPVSSRTVAFEYSRPDSSTLRVIQKESTPSHYVEYKFEN